ncbi:MAG: hypothetical protein KAJ23_14795 [Maribacter sp.]|nr:hypothetical protein [Maribacter sp.]
MARLLIEMPSAQKAINGIQFIKNTKNPSIRLSIRLKINLVSGYVSVDPSMFIN